MSQETTLILFKPDAVKNNLVGECLSRFQKENFSIRGIKMMQLNETILTEHYSHIIDLVINDVAIFPILLQYMSSGPVIALALTGENAIARIRELLGPTNSDIAPKGTIRGDFGKGSTYNVCHASDSPENAAIELKRFFKTDEIFCTTCAC